MAGLKILRFQRQEDMHQNMPSQSTTIVHLGLRSGSGADVVVCKDKLGKMEWWNDFWRLMDALADI